MFESLQPAPPDPILGLTESFKKDPRSDKINLSTGVYKDERGNTPVLNCVKAAEQRLLETEDEKGYLGIDGLTEYAQSVPELLIGRDHEVLQQNRTVTVQTPGGTGALRVAADFLSQRLSVRRMWISQPTWANHTNVFQAAGLQVESYAYLDSTGTRLDFSALLESLNQIPAGDAICLHAACHNPTGIDPTLEQWREIGEVIRNRELLPLVDFAYQGIGRGLVEDSTGLRELLALHRNLLICSSFSKNFSLYGERVGALTLVAESESAAQTALTHVKSTVRANYSNPPKHGAAIVACVLADTELTGQWESELSVMRDRINEMRRLFAETLIAEGVERDFSFVTRQQGMFSFSGLTPIQVDELRSKHSIYIVGSGRINVAGMTASNMGHICAAIKAVLNE